MRMSLPQKKYVIIFKQLLKKMSTEFCKSKLELTNLPFSYYVTMLPKPATCVFPQNKIKNIDMFNKCCELRRLHICVCQLANNSRTTNRFILKM